MLHRNEIKTIEKMHARESLQNYSVYKPFTYIHIPCILVKCQSSKMTSADISLRGVICAAAHHQAWQSSVLKIRHCLQTEWQRLVVLFTHSPSPMHSQYEESIYHCDSDRLCSTHIMTISAQWGSPAWQNLSLECTPPPTPGTLWA